MVHFETNQSPSWDLIFRVSFWYPYNHHRRRVTNRNMIERLSRSEQRKINQNKSFMAHCNNDISSTSETLKTTGTSSIFRWFNSYSHPLINWLCRDEKKSVTFYVIKICPPSLSDIWLTYYYQKYICSNKPGIRVMCNILHGIVVSRMA